MKKFPSKEKNIDYIAYGVIAVYILIFIFLSFGRHDALKSYLNDTSAYDQAIWNTLKGRVMIVSSSLLDEPQFFAARFSPILFFFVPIYAIFASPKWLFLFQALSVGLSAVPVYLLAKEKLKNILVSFIFLVSYLLYPVLHNGLLYDFHEIVFAVGFAAWAFYFLEKRNDKLFILFAFLMILSQEYLALLVFMMGICLIFFKKRRKFGAMVAIAALFYYILTVSVIMPHFSTTGKAAFLANNMALASRYGWLGSGFPEIIKNILIHPLFVLKVISSFDRLRYLFLLVAPIFSLALFSWPFLIALPVIFLYLISMNSITYNIFFYHSAILAPFVFFAAIYTYKKWFLEDKFLRRIFAVFILTFSLGASILYGVSPLSPYYKTSDYIPSAHAKKIKEVEKIIPPEASLSVQHNLGPHFSERELIWRFPLHKDDAQYILLDTFDPYASNPKQLFVFPYALQMEVGDWQQAIEDLKNSKKYDLIFQDDGYLLFRARKNA